MPYYPNLKYTNSMKAQLRPSTGLYDQKESLWLQHRSQWPSDEDVPGFRNTTAHFMAKCAAISNQLCRFCVITRDVSEN